MTSSKRNLSMYTENKEVPSHEQIMQTAYRIHLEASLHPGEVRHAT